MEVTSIKCAGCLEVILPDEEGNFSCESCGTFYSENSVPHILPLTTIINNG